MSFGFSVGDFIAVIELVSKVRKDFADAPREFQGISDEVRSLSIFLQDVDIFLSGHDVTEAQKKHLCDIVHSCRSVLQDTQGTLDKYSSLKSKEKSIGSTAKRAWKRLTWEPADICDLRIRIASNITLLNSFLEGYSRDNVVKLIKRHDHQEHQEVLDWLSPIDYAAQHSDFVHQHQAGTGQWFLDSPEYQKWVATEKEILFCPGIPGAGKTIITSVVVENLYDKFEAGSSVGTCYMYCNYRRKDEQRLDAMLLSLIKQLAQAQPSVPQSVRKLYDRHKIKRTRPSLDDICKTLHSVAASLSRVFVVIDALDECQTSGDCRSKFISEVLNLHARLGANIVATSRFIPEISERFCEGVSLEIRASNDDIGRYLNANLSCLPKFVSGNLSLQTDIKQTILECVDGMFLLARLHLDSLRGKRSPKAIRTTLGGFARGSDAYDTAYNDAMERIQSQLADQKDLAMQALSWITCAKRPLTTAELQNALGVELDMPELDEENLPDLDDLVSSCCGLLTIDGESDIIRLVHFTTQEYFERTQHNWFPDAQYEILRTCITYLSFQAFESGRCANDFEFEKRLSSYPLYDYASHYWGDHAGSAGDHQCTSNFLMRQSIIDSSCQALLAVKQGGDDGDYSQTPTRMTRVHLAAFFGLHNAILTILDNQNLDKKNSSGRTPLSFAAENGHESIVRLFIESGADVNSKDIGGRTPLWWTIASGDDQDVILRLLIGNGADVDCQDDFGRNPLWLATSFNHDSLVQLLIENGADVQAHDSVGRSCLFYTIERGQDNYFNLLLANERIQADRRDFYGATPLSVAVRFGRDFMVRRLLAIPDVDIASKDNFGRTPLWWAQKQGHTYISECLLESARDRGILMTKSEMPVGSPDTFGVGRGGYCDVCWAHIREVYYHCEYCDGDDFDICVNCKGMGAQCLVQSHALSYCNEN